MGIQRTSVAFSVVLVIAGAFVGASSGRVSPGVGQDRSKASAVAEVWALEDTYWRYVQAGDVEKYMGLWHDDFTGWGCGGAKPMTKETVGNWVKTIRDEKVRYRYSLTREGAVASGNVVVVYYRTPMVSVYPDGRVEGRVNDQDEDRKLTHTWLRTGESWKIIGGMCAAVATQAK